MWLLVCLELDGEIGMTSSNLRYNYEMEFGHKTRSIFNAFGEILKRVANGVATEIESSPLERRLSDGCELMGEYNFRTGKLDRGSDPIGWYEDDV